MKKYAQINKQKGIMRILEKKAPASGIGKLHNLVHEGWGKKKRSHQYQKYNLNEDVQPKKLCWNPSKQTNEDSLKDLGCFEGWDLANLLYHP